MGETGKQEEQIYKNKKKLKRASGCERQGRGGTDPQEQEKRK